MKTQLLGKTSLKSTRLSYGNMRCVSTWDPKNVTPEKVAEGSRAHITAYEAGYTLFDTADVYAHGVCETVLGGTLKQVSGMREKILIATKCGIRLRGEPNADSPQRYDFSAEYIIWSCENSLKRMGIETIDLYQLHRPDVLMNPPEVAKAFDKLKSSGKVKEFGVSNFLPSTLSALQAHLPMKIAVNQVQIHLGFLNFLEDGTLDQCIERTITPLAYSPVGGGWLGTGRTLAPDAPNRENRQKLLDLLDNIAGQYGVSRTVINLAWLMKHPSGIIPIIGSNNPEHIKDAARVDDIDLSREHWYALYLAARGKALP